MSNNTQIKPMVAYKGLNESDKKLTHKLIISLHKKELSGSSWHAINRTINRERRDPNTTGKRYTNGYLIFYKERFAEKKSKDKPVTIIAKELGAEWKGLTDDEKTKYSKQAAEQR